MALAASRSLWEATGPHDVYVDLVGVQSNHGVGAITLDVEVVITTEPGLATLNLVRPSRRPRRRPRIVFPQDPEPPTSKPDTVIDLVGVQSNRGVGRIIVEANFDLTDDERLMLLLLLADE